MGPRERREGAGTKGKVGGREQGPRERRKDGSRDQGKGGREGAGTKGKREEATPLNL